MKPKIILIGGGSASGKTLLANKIKEIMGDSISIMNLDNFYRHRPDLTYEERVLVNYDHPDSIDDELIFDKLKQLVLGKDIQIPVYDFAKHLRSEKTTTIKNNKYILVDGIFALYYPNLMQLADYKIFMNADEDIRLERRVKRDVKERGRTKESVLKQFEETVGPMHNIYIEPTKNNADFIFNNNKNDGLNEATVNKLIYEIKSL